MTGLSIGAAARQLGVAADTLRYYDRIGLVRPAARGPAGRRRYVEVDMVKLRFVQRAQAMNFQLKEIGILLKLRERPADAQTEARRVTAQKLAEVETRLKTLSHLRNELRLMLAPCDGTSEKCPILAAMGMDRVQSRPPRRVRQAGSD